MVLIQDGNIEWADAYGYTNLKKKIPIEYINENKPITTRHLMTHQSGFPTSVDINKIWERKSQRTLRELASEMKANINPEEKFQYCNDCFSLKGLLIEDITEISFEEYIWKNILRPLEIETYGFLYPTPEMVEDLALPYHFRYNKAFPTNQVHIEHCLRGYFLDPNGYGKVSTITYQWRKLLRSLCQD